MTSHSKKQSRPQASKNIVKSGSAPHTVRSVDYPFLSLQRAVGNQAIRRLFQADNEDPESSSDIPAKNGRAQDVTHSSSPADVQPKLLPTIQKKSLEVSHPTGADEKEADEVARKVIEGQPAEIHEKGVAVNRDGTAAADITPEFHSKLESSKGGGRTLDGPTRSEMESRMGVDFAGVKVHTGNDAHELSESLNARAFTHGSDVYFRHGEFDPSSKRGKELLAHELVHTQQQSGLRRKIQRQTEKDGDKGQTEKSKDGGAVKGITYPKDYSAEVDKILKFLLGPYYLKALPYVTVKAKMVWEIKFASQPEEEKQKLATEFGAVEVKGQLSKRLYEVTLSGFKAKNDAFEDPKDPEIKFGVSPNFEVLTAKLEGPVPDVALLKMTLKAAYQINKGNLETQHGFIHSVLEKHAGLYKALEDGKISIEGSFNISISVGLKALAKYLKNLSEKTVKELAEKKHIGEKVEHKEKAKASKAKKNEALKKKNELETKLKQKRDEVKRVQKNKTLTPEEAKEKINSLEKEIADKQKEADKAAEAWQKEKEAMQKAQKLANEEEKAARKVGREAKKLGKEIRQFEEKAGSFKKRIQDRYQKAIEKLKQKIERQQRWLDKLKRRLADKAAKWLEKKAVKWLGRKLALKVAEVAAQIFLRVIPIIGELLLIADAAVFLWDLFSALWDWLSGKEKEDNGEAEGEGETGEGGEAKDAGTVPGGADTDDVDKVPGGEIQGEGTGTTPTGKDTTGKDTTGTGGTVTPHKDSPPVTPTDTTEMTKKTPVQENGQVVPWQQPPYGATSLNLLSYGAVESVAGKLISGQVYEFKLLIRYINEDGKTAVIQSNEKKSFTYVGIKDGFPRFKVAEPFVIKTNELKIYFRKDYPLKVSSN